MKKLFEFFAKPQNGLTFVGLLALTVLFLQYFKVGITNGFWITLVLWGVVAAVIYCTSAILRALAREMNCFQNSLNFGQAMLESG